MEQSSKEILLEEVATSLPILNLDAIARTVATKVADTTVLAQLLFLEGQYLFVTTEKQETTYKFVSPAALKQAFAEEVVDSNWLPGDTVRWGQCRKGEWLVQFYPAQRYQIELSNLELDVPVTVVLPAFVFVGCGNQYWLWAVKSKTFDPNAQIFHAPLPNVMSDGSICFGANLVPVCSPTTVEQVWNLFWSSPFNDHIVHGKSRANNQDVRFGLLSLHSKKTKKYPLQDLVPIPNKTISSAIEQIINERKTFY